MTATRTIAAQPLLRGRARAPAGGTASRRLLRGRVLAPTELDADLIALWKQFCLADPIYRSPFYWPQFTLAVALSRADARVAVLEQDGDIVGFLPFHAARGAVGKPIGGHISDYHGPVLAPGVAVSGEELLGASGLAAYDYNHMPCAFAALTRAASGTANSPQMDLSGGYEAYVAARDSRWTKAQREVRRRHRKTEEEHGPVRFAWHDPSDRIFGQLIEMKNLHYARMGIGMRLGAGWAGEVIERLRRAQEPDFAAVISTLHAGERLIAAHFGLRTASLLHWWFPTYDPDLARLGPGIGLVNHCAMQAGHMGIDTIDFGRGNEDFKLHFADRHVALSEGSIAMPGSLASGLRRGGEALVALAGRLPLGRYRSYPARAVARLLSGVTLRE